MRDLKLRPEEIGSAVSKVDIDEWRAALEAFLMDQANEEAKAELENKSSAKWQRLATYDLVCAMDWQLVVTSGYGWNMCSTTHEHTLKLYRAQE